MSLASNVTPILMGVLAVALLIELPTLIKILSRSAPSGDSLSGTSGHVPSTGTPAGHPLLAPEGVTVIGALRLPLPQSGGASLTNGNTP